MSLSITFRSWRTIGMTILAKDNTNTSISFTDHETEMKGNKPGASKAKAGDLNFNLKAKLSRRAAA